MKKDKLTSKRKRGRFPYLWMEILIIIIMVVYTVVCYKTLYLAANDIFYRNLWPVSEVMEEIATSEEPLAATEIVTHICEELNVSEAEKKYFGFVIQFYDEQGNILSEYMNDKYQLNEKAYERLEIIPKHWIEYPTESLEPGDSYDISVGTYELRASVACHNVYFRAIMLYSPIIKILGNFNFWSRMIPFWILCQGGALLFFLYQRKLRQKQQKYEQMRNTFINAMAHEMKTPAAVIRNSAECVQENIAPEKNPYYLEMIVSESERMNNLLSKMLLYTRTSEGIYELNKEAFYLSDVLNGVVENNRLAAEFRGLTFEVQENDTSSVEADRALIAMVLGNLISNAVKFAAENSAIVVTLYKTGCSVYNEGIQLTAEQTERIWEPLYMTDQSRTDQDGSSGMGLAICKNILELHGARYGVENQEAGVRFFFEL